MPRMYPWLQRLLPTLAFISAIPLSSQEAGKSFGERIDVSVVNVDVFVSDRKGNPVRDLEVTDFELFEDGRRVEISQFYAASEARDAPGASGRVAAGAPAAREPLQLVVVLDNVNTRFGNRSLFLARVREILATQLRPTDRVMLASYDRAIRIHLPFSSDAEAIRSGLARLEAAPNLGTDMDGESSVTMEALWYAVEEESVQGCEQLTEAAISRHVGSVTHRVLSATEALADLMRSLGTIPGRKALLYVSDGLEIRPGAHLARQLELICKSSSASFRADSLDIALALKRMTSVANASRVTLYPFDAAGSSSGMAQSRNQLVANELRSSQRDSLAFLAADTGGRALLNNLDFGSALRAVEEDAGSVYSLGYLSSHDASRKQRAIEVRVKRKGVEVRYRHGHFSRSDADILRERLLAALWLGEIENPLGARLDPAGAVRQIESFEVAPLFAVPLRVGIPISALTLSPAGEQREGKLTIFVTAEGADGSRAQMSVAEVPVRVAESYFQSGKQELYGYELTLTMRAGRQTIAVGVQDDVGGEVTVLTHEIEVGGAAAEK